MKKIAEKIFLVGRRIYLRPLNQRDINKKYLSWLNDSEVTKYMEIGIFPTTKNELQDYYERINKSKTDVMFAIVTKKQGRHIGNIKLGNINWVHRFAELGIMIGDKRYWSKGYGQEACQLLLKYAFNRLNLNKVILGVHAPHKAAIKAYQKVGFQIEGRLTKMLNLDGKYVDKVYMGILQRDFNKD
ncbi:GNAT family N-acetyltransferase [bacterium]|nr:GNAT family N-acetyltransferase [bacterium]